jgi:hypothetical protein
MGLSQACGLRPGDPYRSARVPGVPEELRGLWIGNQAPDQTALSARWWQAR